MKTMRLLLTMLLLLPVSLAYAESQEIQKYTLDNGLTVLVKQTNNNDDVALRLFIKFGSADEVDGQRGTAHILEHMIFKGTTKLSETDVRNFCTKLQCSLNAYTDHNHTCIQFKIARDIWQETMPILAEMFGASSIKQTYLDSEVNAILQEVRELSTPVIDSLFETLKYLFPEHTYQHPRIGYKKDIIDITAKGLQALYAHNYIPNNAILVVVGNIDPQEVVSQAQKHFGLFKAQWNYSHQRPSVNFDQKACTLELANNVKATKQFLLWKQPIPKNMRHSLETFVHLFINSDESILQKKLVDKNLVNKIEFVHWDFTDASMLGFMYEPSKISDIETINAIIKESLADAASNGFNEADIQKSLAQDKKLLANFLENNENQADEIGTAFINFNDEYFPYTRITNNTKELNQHIKELISKHFPTKTMHTVLLKPWNNQEKRQYQEKLKQEDLYQTVQLQNRTRSIPIEPARYTINLAPRTTKESENKKFEFTSAEMTLANGISVTCVNVPQSPLIYFSLQHKADDRYFKLHHTYKGVNLIFEAISNSSVNRTDNTYNFSEDKITGQVSPDQFTNTLTHITNHILQPTFSEQALIEAQQKTMANIRAFWDSTDRIGSTLPNYLVAGKRMLPDEKITQTLSIEDCKNLYNQIMWPNKASLVIVGDMSNITDLKALLESTVGTWTPAKHDLLEDEQTFINVIKKYTNSKKHNTVMHHYADQEGVDIIIFGPSLPLTNNQCILPALYTYGINLRRRLFNLREQSGIFYDISTQVLRRIGDHYHWMIRTSTSPDQVNEAISQIKEFIKKDIATFNDEELAISKTLAYEALRHENDSGKAIFSSLLTLQSLGLPYDFHKHIDQTLQNFTPLNIHLAAQKYIDVDHCNVVLVGRQGNIDTCSQAQI